MTIRLLSEALADTGITSDLQIMPLSELNLCEPNSVAYKGLSATILAQVANWESVLQAESTSEFTVNAYLAFDTFPQLKSEVEHPYNVIIRLWHKYVSLYTSWSENQPLPDPTSAKVRIKVAQLSTPVYAAFDLPGLPAVIWREEKNRSGYNTFLVDSTDIAEALPWSDASTAQLRDIPPAIYRSIYWAYRNLAESASAVLQGTLGPNGPYDLWLDYGQLRQSIGTQELLAKLTEPSA